MGHGRGTYEIINIYTNLEYIFLLYAEYYGHTIRTPVQGSPERRVINFPQRKLKILPGKVKTYKGKK